MMDYDKIKAGVRLILEGIGEDVKREGLLETPDRIARMCGEIYGGLYEDPAKHLQKQFTAANDGMVVETDITFYSTCEHHLLPFYGKAHIGYIALGSNMGDKKGYLEMGVEGLRHTRGCRVEAVSDFLVTEPYGLVEQDKFLNGAMKIRTLLTPHELLDRLNEIEQTANRERIVRWGPRTLDLDILLYDDWILDDERLHIPHIEMYKREFVLEPLCQIAPYVRHPVWNRTALELLEELKRLR